jgi:hypothetical protein
MLLAVQKIVQLCAHLVVASTMGLSIAIAAAGALHQRPLNLARSTYPVERVVYAEAATNLVVAGLR